MNQIMNVPDEPPITLDDGTILDQRQSAACVLRATEDLTYEQIAEIVNYSNGSACGHFLRSDRGMKGIQVAVRQHLNEGARVGLQAMVKLAKSAKSENVRQLAAADLMDRAGLRTVDAGQRDAGMTGGREVSITINTGPGSEQSTITIEGEAQ